MTETSLDIHEEILVILQVNDLIRCKSVCKSWYSLISSPRFAKSQLNFNLKKKADNNEIGNTRISSSLAATSLCNDKEYLVGSSNGLVCVSCHVTEFLVVNPSTREVNQLGNPLGEDNYSSAFVWGFGYDSSIDDYKVVIGFYNLFPRKRYFKVLTLKSNIWRSVDVASGYDFWGKGILCNGAIHWHSSQDNKQVIVSFDLSKEVFKEIQPPELRRSDWNLGTMNDCLCIVARPTIFYKDLQIWVMRSYDVQESWERKLPPPGYHTRKPVMSYDLPEDFLNSHVEIWLLEEGSGAPVLVRSIKRRHCRYNFRNDYPHIWLRTNSECNYNYDEHVYVKSLVSSHGIG